MTTSTFFAPFGPVSMTPTLSYFVGVSGSSKPASRFTRTGTRSDDWPLAPAPATAVVPSNAALTAIATVTVTLRSLTPNPPVADVVTLLDSTQAAPSDGWQ